MQICDDCLDIIFYIKNKYRPENTSEIELTSIIFSLEKDIQRTRYSLNKVDNLEQIQSHIDEQLVNLKKLESNLNVRLKNIDNRMFTEIKSLKLQYEKLLYLFKI